jgi:hypothetical protein
MKRRIPNISWGMVLLTGLLLSGCAIAGGESDLDKLEGEWEWLRTTGGTLDEPITPNDPGYDPIRYLFTWDEQYRYFRNDTLRGDGFYEFERVDNNLYLDFYPQSGPELPGKEVQFPHQDTLWLFEQCEGCTRQVYTRINTND